MSKKCAVCDDNAFGFYPLCKKHLDMTKTGEVVKDSKGKWCLKDKVVTTNYNNPWNKNKEQIQKEIQQQLEEINKEQKQIGENNVVVINNDSKSRCITCGKKTDGLLFCGNCYHKYQNKELLFKITNCSNVELLDESYEGRYTCKDGHIVKSKSERDIDNYLFEAGIAHAYEKELSYGASDKEVLHPDFFLLDYLGKGKHVYIEHWGYEENNIQYTQTKKFKMPIYKKLGITLINTYEKTDAKDIDSALTRKIKKENIKEGQINYEE